MFSSYRRILAVPGAALFSATGLIARLPISMIGLGIVFLVEGASGSYGRAGTVSAVFLAASAVIAVVQGRIIDRVGQARVLVPAITVWGTGLTLLVVTVNADAPTVWWYASALLAGLGMPVVGNCVRQRWAHVLPDAGERQTAFALEAVADEAVFILGPILVTVLATTGSPVAALAVAISAGVLGTYALSAQRATEPPKHPRVAGSLRDPMPWLTVLPLTALCACLGTLFGAAEVTTVAFAEEAGSKAASGFLLALWALGSLLAGLLTGAITWRAPLLRRVRLGALAMTAAMLPLAFLEPLWLMGAWLFVAGFAIAPTLIATMSLAEAALPTSRFSEGMAFLQTGLLAGVAPGAAAAGYVVDHSGASAAYWVSAVGGAVALASALATRAPASLRREPDAVPAAVTPPPG